MSIVVNGIVLDRLTTEDLIDFAADLSQDGHEAKDEGDEALAADIWTKLQTVDAAITARIA